MYTHMHIHIHIPYMYMHIFIYHAYDAKHKCSQDIPLILSPSFGRRPGPFRSPNSGHGVDHSHCLDSSDVAIAMLSLPPIFDGLYHP